MGNIMGQIEEIERDRAEIEVKIQRGNEEIKEIKEKLEKKERQLEGREASLANCKKKNGLNHENVRKLQTQVEELKTEVEQLKREHKKKEKEINENAKKLSNEHFDVDVVSGLIIPKSS